MPSEKASGGSQGHPAALGRVGAKTRSVTTKSHRMRVGTASSPTPPAADVPDAATTLRSALSVITTVGTPLTIITALMLYFGWARSNAQSNWMGIEVSLFHFSAQDYVLRSISTLFVPLLVACGVGIAWLEIHRRICAMVDPAAGEPDGTRSGHDHHVRRHRHRHRQCGARIDEAGVATGTGGLPIITRRRNGIRRIRSPAHPPRQRTGGGGELRAALAEPLTESSRRRGHRVSGVLGGRRVRRHVGRGIGQEIEQTVGALPRATAISETPLGIDAPNVATKAITVGAQTLYRTTGLRLLGESGGRLFLLNDGWSRRSGSIIVLDANKSVRWQFGR